jgi:clan AA aspartic protease
MGNIWVNVKLVNPLTGLGVEVKALADTGVTYTIIPWYIHEKLNFMVIGKKRVKTTRGYVDLDESFALIEIQGKRAITPILLSRELEEVLVGVITLEALGLTVDPVTGRLKETEILLLTLSK